MSALLFVYGTLKRGCRNHRQMAGQSFVATARTAPGFTLVDLGGYPGLVETPEGRTGVTGEVWRVEPEALARLDRFEGIDQGLYRRGPIALQAPFNGQPVEAYFPLGKLTDRPVVGSSWIE